MIQASLVDTWAATAAGAYTLTENTLYTVEAFNDYLDHLTDDGVLTITRWVARRPAAGVAGAGGVRAARLVGRGSARDRAARPRRDVPPEEDAVHRRTRSPGCARSRRSSGSTCSTRRTRRSRRRAAAASADHRPARTSSSTARRPATTRGSILAADREQFYATYPIRHPADDRRSSVLLPHDEARGSVRRRVRPDRCCSATA